MANLSALVGPSNVLTTTNTVTATNKTFTTPTLNNPTITNYTESAVTGSGTAYSVSLTNGTVHSFTTTGNATVTLPAASNGKSFIVIVNYGGAHSLGWAGGTTIKWAGGAAPTPTSVSGKIDIFSFFQDGSTTYGSVVGRNF